MASPLSRSAGFPVIVWNYHDQDVAAPDFIVEMVIAGLPQAAIWPIVRYYRIDLTHSSWLPVGRASHASPIPKRAGCVQ
jgi:hypothetical protein